MKILHLLASIDPRAGGPVEGVRRSSVAMQDAGHEIEVATCDAPGDAYLAAFPFPVHAFGPVNSRYSYSAQLAPWLVANANRFDAVIVHGLWQYHGFAAWKALRQSDVPYYVYVHGMLDPWFKQAYPLKHLKKWLYWPWAEYRVLRDARAVIYTTEEERARARQSFWLYRANEQIVPFGTTVPPLEAAPLARSLPASRARLARQTHRAVSRTHACEERLRSADRGIRACRRPRPVAASRDRGSRRGRLGAPVCAPRRRRPVSRIASVCRACCRAISSGARFMPATCSFCRRIRRTSAWRLPKRSAADCRR